MRIAVDGMGGDHAPGVVLQAVQAAAARWSDLDFLLVGMPKALPRNPGPRVKVVTCGSVILMADPPLAALRQKRDSSISIALDLHQRGEADAVLSAGSTGAQVAASLKHLGRLPGVRRPAIISVLPSLGRPLVLLDVGASSDATAAELLQYARMGHIFSQAVLGVESPGIALLSIGEEPGKGNRAVVEAHKSLLDSDLRFLGNLEGRDVLAGKADVLVCDGFTGNITLKFAESILPVLKSRLVDHIQGRPLRLFGAALLKPAIRELRQEFNYEEYGGAPLIGVQGNSVICHGSSSARAIESAIGVTRLMLLNKVNDRITRSLQEHT